VKVIGTGAPKKYQNLVKRPVFQWFFAPHGDTI